LNSLKTEFGAPDKLDGDAASKIIASAKWEDYSVVGFDAGDLGVKAGDIVSVASTSIRECRLPHFALEACFDHIVCRIA